MSASPAPIVAPSRLRYPSSALHLGAPFHVPVESSRTVSRTDCTAGHRNGLTSSTYHYQIVTGLPPASRGTCHTSFPASSLPSTSGYFYISTEPASPSISARRLMANPGILVLSGTLFGGAGSLLVLVRRAMLYIIGLGLGNEKDITLRGLEAVKKCQKVYIEAYTSLLSFGVSPDGLSRLEKLYGKPVTVAGREMVEEQADVILMEALESNVAFLVVGDPFGATTHTDLVVRAKKLGVEVQVIHNASVMNAIGVCGLQLYRFGETISIPFFTETWRPDSFYEKIHRNQQLGLHTLCLLDIQVKEPSLEHLCRGKKRYLPPRYMTINTAIHQLLEVEQARGEEAYTEESKCIGVARLGNDDQMVVAGSMKELFDVDFGPPLHCLVIVGKTHHVEEEMLEFYAIK